MVGKHKRSQVLPLSSGLPQHVVTNFGMATHQHPFLISQWTRLMQDGRGDGDFAKIMHKRRQAKAVLSFLR
jgi:hypothetical protein